MALTQTLEELKSQLMDVARQTTSSYDEVLRTAIQYLTDDSSEAENATCLRPAPFALEQPKSPDAYKDDVYSVDDLAKRWKRSRDSIYRRVKEGKLSPFRVGKAFYFTAAEVYRYEHTS